MRVSNLFGILRLLKNGKNDVGTILTTASGEIYEAGYIIGCDGARSVVREQAGLVLRVRTRPIHSLHLDVKEDEENPLPLERTFHYQHPAMGGRNVMFVPFKGGWRVDLQLLETDNPYDFTSMEGIKQWLPKVMDTKYADRVTWVSTYRFHQVVANSLTDEKCRVLLAGEAAHLFAPFGARGLNSGVPDALKAVSGIEQALQAESEEKRRRAISLSSQGTAYCSQLEPSMLYDSIASPAGEFPGNEFKA